MASHPVMFNYGIQPKIRTSVFNTESSRECDMAARANIPFNYVPPPDNVVVNHIPVQWPAAEQWSRSFSWEPAQF